MKGTKKILTISYKTILRIVHILSRIIFSEKSLSVQMSIRPCFRLCVILSRLLEEIWTKILSYLDEYTLQNVASLVCKDWLNVIRNDCKLSGHLTLKRFIYFADINSMLRNNWPKLKVGQIYLIL